MLAAPVERGVASAAYSFVRFGGGAIAPYLAGKLGEAINPHVPFWVGAGPPSSASRCCSAAAGCSHTPTTTTRHPGRATKRTR